MNTAFLLMAQYQRAVVPIEAVAADYFGLTRDKLLRKIQAGDCMAGWRWLKAVTG